MLLLSRRVSGPVLIKGQWSQRARLLASGFFFKPLLIPHWVSHTVPFVAPESLEETLKGCEWESPVFSPACSPSPSFGKKIFLRWITPSESPCYVVHTGPMPLSGSRGWLWTWSRPSRALVIDLGINTWPRLRTWDFNTRVWLNFPEREPPPSARLTMLVECRLIGITSGELAYKCQH